MTTTYHTEVEAGSRHAIHNLSYSNRANREAGTNEGSGIELAAANVGQVALETSTVTYWILTDHSPITWVQLLACRAADVLKLDIQEGGIVKYFSEPIELDDGEYYDTDVDIAGFATIMLTRSDTTKAHECAKVYFNNGNIDDIYLSANASLVDLGSKMCILGQSTGLRIKNNLGYTAKLVIDMNYCTNVVGGLGP